MLLQSSLFLLLALWATSVAAQAKIAAAYAPSTTQCPSGTQLLRQVPSGGNISGAESALLKSNSVLARDVKSYLTNLASYVNKSLPGTTLPNYLSSNSTTTLAPRLGLSISGGGYRAAIFGLSVFHAFDSRNASSVDSGLGGVLQLSTYMAGLSGGSWAVGSLAQANFPTIPEVFFGPSSTAAPGGWGGWNADQDILASSNLTYGSILLTAMAGKAAKFPVTFADLWALALARHFANGTTAQNFFDDSNSTHGAGVTFSSITDLSALKEGSMPFPIVTLNSRLQNTQNGIIAPSSGYVPLNNTLYEISPVEFGSWDAQLSAFTPTRFIGSQNTSVCAEGFDRAAFVIGTSSNLFNEFNISAAALANSSIGPVIPFINASYVSPAPQGSLQRNVELDVAVWPNPFHGLNASTFADSGQQVLSLVDGGEDGQVIPIAPLVVKGRNLEVVIAIDASNDAGGFAGGGSIVASQNRTTGDPTLASIYPLPPLPTSTSVFTAAGLAKRPTFFGCGNFTTSNGTNITTSGERAPLIIYIANGGPPPGQSPVTNTTTTQTVYSNNELQGFFDQTLAIATQGFSGSGNTTKDSEWPLCLACAIFEPARLKASTSRAAACESCFSRYCWDGSNSDVASSSGSGGSGTNSSAGSSPTGKSSAVRSKSVGVLCISVAVVWLFAALN